MQDPSEEQQYVVDNIISGKNVVVDACAGSGKSTTILSCAKQFTDKTFLQMTFNKSLRKEILEITEKNNISNINIHTFHSIAVHYYYAQAYDDNGIRKLLRENMSPKLFSLPKIDVLVLDECQDMSILYFQLMVKIMMDMKHPFQLLILGDKRQGIYEYKGAHNGFLTNASRFWENHLFLKTKEFIYCSLQMSYRITNTMSDFVNQSLLGENRLLACKTGIPVKYYRRKKKAIVAIIHTKIQELLREGNNYGDFFILAATMKHKTILLLENELVQSNIPCYIPMKENQEQLDDRIIDKKIVFSTFHSVKGRQRKHVFIIGFDSSYMEYYNKDSPKDTCPNTLYVGCTRATNSLYLFETENNSYESFRPLPFLKMSHTEMITKDFVDFIGNPMIIAPIVEKKESDSYNIKKNTPTSLVEFASDSALEIISPILEKIFILEKEAETDMDTNIDIPSVFETKYGFFEEVSNLNGIVIPIMFYDSLRPEKATNTLQRMISQDIQKFKPDEHVFLHNIVKDIPETCTKISDYLYLANVSSAIETELYSKLKQIERDEYEWLNENKLSKYYERLNNNVGEECRNGKWYPEKMIIHHSCDEDHFEIDELFKKMLPFNEYKFRFTARIDLDTETTIWELKCTSQITIEHKMQTVIYAWLYQLVYNKKKIVRLFNIKTGEIWRIDAEIEELTKIVVELVRGKCNKNEKKTEIEYIEECNRFMDSLSV
jgi:hypothetical protein